MTVSARFALLLALFPRTIAPGGPGVPIRWSIEIKGPATIERAELRLQGRVGRILLENSDSAFQLLTDLRITGDSIFFTVPRGQRSFAGVMSDGKMQGVVRDGDGNVAHWSATRLAAQSDIAPVGRRFMVRQLVLGGDSGSERVPGAWIARLPDAARLDAEYRQLAQAAALPVDTGAALPGRPRRIALGFDAEWRRAQCALLARIGASAASDLTFRHLFLVPNGCRVDLFDVASEQAIGHYSDFRLDDAIRGLTEQLRLNLNLADSASIREAAWSFWCKGTRDSDVVAHRFGAWATRDMSGARALQALLAGYDDAIRWWQDAVHWLLKQPWIDTPEGARSPAQLVAAFWGVDSFALPTIVPEPYGDFEAFPVVGVAALGRRLVRPLNASAAEWVTTAGIGDVITQWADVSFGDAEEPLPVTMNGKTRYVMSPAAMNRRHGGSMVAPKDLIRIDPGITPILAVATVVHEWQHLIIGGRRLQGSAPQVRDSPTELRLRADDPWLAEGAAEWASEESLRSARATVPILALFDAEKRRALAAGAPDDTHAFGYLLVRAAAEHAGSRVAIEGRLVQLLHDLPAFAVASGFAGPSRVPTRTLDRPTSTTVIPEITFLLGGDDDLHPTTHRLLISTPRPEQ